MINVDEIAKECEQMIGDGLDFIAPKSCCNAKQVAELVVMLRDAQRNEARYLYMRDAGLLGAMGDEMDCALDTAMEKKDCEP